MQNNFFLFLLVTDRFGIQTPPLATRIIFCARNCYRQNQNQINVDVWNSGRNHTTK
jgi:hypothetical protein